MHKEREKEREGDRQKKCPKLMSFQWGISLLTLFQIIPIKGQRFGCPKYESLVKLWENLRK